MKIRRKQLVCLLTAAGMLAIYCVLTGISGHLAGLRRDQYAAERWAGEGDVPYAQLSAFLSDDAGLTGEGVETMRDAIDSAMVSASLAASHEDARLWYDAYSAQAGTAFVTGVKGGGMQAEVTAVGGDFFALHGQTLAGGAYIYENDLMEDRVVLDEALAWALFGSPDIAGQMVQIGGRNYSVAGVVETETDYAAESAYGDLPRMYISFALYEQWQAETGRTAYVHCYEAVLPDPVRNFAWNTLEGVMAGENRILLQNTGRFSLGSTWETLMGMHDLLVVSERIAYPCWENAARIISFDLALLLAARLLLLVFPVLCGLWLLWRGYRYLDGWIRRRMEAYRMRYRSLIKEGNEDEKN